MDGRVRTDFASNMGEDPDVALAPGVFPRIGGQDALAEFKAKFDPDALFLICGCNGQDAGHGGWHGNIQPPGDTPGHSHAGYPSSLFAPDAVE